MDLASLRSALSEIETISNESWLTSLSDRKLKELSFHDRDRDREQIKQLDQDTYEKFYGNKKYYQATEPSKLYVENWIAEKVRGKVFLDYACGNGMYAIKAAAAGAGLSIGLDISSVSVANAREDAKKAGVQDNSFFVQADAENTKLPDSSVDVVLCSGMLHHLDLSYAFPELRRILAPGGVILGVEALDYNPLIKLYRMMTPDMRTEWEKAHILKLADLRFAKRFFDVKNVKYWHITSIAAPFARPLLPIFHGIDSLLTKIPLAQLMSWIFTFELHSSKKA